MQWLESATARKVWQPWASEQAPASVHLPLLLPLLRTLNAQLQPNWSLVQLQGARGRLLLPQGKPLFAPILLPLLLVLLQAAPGMLPEPGTPKQKKALSNREELLLLARL